MPFNNIFTQMRISFPAGEAALPCPPPTPPPPSQCEALQTT